ncbi:homocysteine S-methyltransferase [Thalassotalea litorea]|uniref:homocysteine S-methyltransferase n=1 Tax=Thalassotalea litorea TaxID=2020715 RepID=UPI00373705D7
MQSKRIEALKHSLDNGRVLLIDGGLATQLEHQGHDLNHPMWSAKLLLEDPDAIINAHLAYLRAGAQCIITSSYQASVAGFETLGLSKEKAIDALKLSVTLAKKAVDSYVEESSTASRPFVAASIGPYGAYLADGSEYRGNYGVSDETLYKFHSQRMSLLAQAGADFFACETIPSIQEAKVIATLLTENNQPGWISFSCQNLSQICEGSLFTDAIVSVENCAEIIAVGINCTAPEYVESLLKRGQQVTRKPLLVYPNSGECYHPDSKTWDGNADPQSSATSALRWVNAGASIIGGCCRMGPDHIKAMSEALKDR